MTATALAMGLEGSGQAAVMTACHCLCGCDALLLAHGWTCQSSPHNAATPTTSS